MILYKPNLSVFLFYIIYKYINKVSATKRNVLNTKLKNKLFLLFLRANLKIKLNCIKRPMAGNKKQKKY